MVSREKVWDPVPIPPRYTLLRLLFGVVLEPVAVYVFTGVDVLNTEMFSGSESESWTFGQTGSFLFKGAINLSISF